jgi:hypothetical protein
MFKKAQSQSAGMFSCAADFQAIRQQEPAENAPSAFESLVRTQLYELLTAHEDQACSELITFIEELLLNFNTTQKPL